MLLATNTVQGKAIGKFNIPAVMGYGVKTTNNEPYRLVSYQKSVAGLSQSFYDYDGPNGKGTVQSETSPKVMAARVCIKLAEIINANYWG